MSLDPALRSRIESLLQANRVVLFMKGQPGMPQCGFSAKATGVLEDLGVEYAHVNVLADQEIREGIKAFGNWPTIPQLYIDGELIGGSDIIEQLSASGELAQLLGLPAPDRTPPQVTVTEAAAEKLRGALGDEGNALSLAIDARFQPRFQIAPRNDNAIAVETAGLRIQFDPASACCACPTSRAIARGPSPQKRAEGWVWVWLPMPWPRRRISPTRSGRACARSPTRKKVACAPWRSSASRIATVSAEGPSSMVSHTSRPRRGSRSRTGMNSAVRGRNTGTMKARCDSSIAGRPQCQPSHHHSSATASCDTSSQPSQACGKRGTRCSVAVVVIAA